jgi:hypothetical protein
MEMYAILSRIRRKRPLADRARPLCADQLPSDPSLNYPIRKYVPASGDLGCSAADAT